MKDIKGKKTYESIEIPEELAKVVEMRIMSNRNEKFLESQKINAQKDTISKRLFQRMSIRICATVFVGCLICFTFALNTSQTFAMEMQKVPVIGALSSVLTIRSYHGVEENVFIDLEIPEIKWNNALSERVNKEIQTIADAYIAEAKQDFADYKEAYFATGGTKEEWAERDMSIIVDYQVQYQTENTLSLELITAKSWVSADEVHTFYNLDLQKGCQLTLEDVLGKDYVEICNKSIRTQITKRIIEDPDAAYFGFGDDIMKDAGFTTVTPETMFYLNKQGNVVVVFGEYEIAPGSMGVQRFEITQ